MPPLVDSGIGPMMSDFQNRWRVAAAGLCPAPGGHRYRWDGSRDSADILSDESRHRAAKVDRFVANPGVDMKGAGPSGEARTALRS